MHVLYRGREGGFVGMTLDIECKIISTQQVITLHLYKCKSSKEVIIQSSTYRVHTQSGNVVSGHATARRLYFLAEGVSLTRPSVLREKFHVEVVGICRSL
jgi:hypothetical protein